MRCSLGLILAVGCGSPISNQRFIEDELFLAALPGGPRTAAPAAVREAQVTDASLLLHAVEAAAELESLTLILHVSGEALRGQEPDERTDVLRRWGSVPTAATHGGQALLWWVSGSVIQPAGGGDLEWVLAVSEEDGGPWVDVGSGRHDPGGHGTVAWDLDAADAIAQLQREESLGPMELEYEELLDTGEPETRYAFPEAVGLPPSYRVQGEEILGWSGPLALTDDGAEWPGAATVRVQQHGGRGEGGVELGGDGLAFEACWTSEGEAVWQGGDPGIESFGRESDCPTGPLES